MRLLVLILSCLVSSVTAFFPSSFFSSDKNSIVSQSTHLSIKEKVPGDSPIETCLDDEYQLIDVEWVDIFPNPPIAGTNLTITASAVLKTDIVEGSYVDILVRYGFIVLVNRRFDLCELAPEVDLECPINAGYIKLQRTVELPEGIPPGIYEVEAQAYTPDDVLLTCLTAEVEIEV